MNQLELQVLGQPLRCRWILLDDGAQVLLDGGHKSHVGAVSVAEPDGEVQTLTFPGHRDQDLSAPWAAALAQKLGCRVCVTCGIHYDGVGRAEIAQIVAAAQALLEQVLAQIAP